MHGRPSFPYNHSLGAISSWKHHFFSSLSGINMTHKFVVISISILYSFYIFWSCITRKLILDSSSAIYICFLMFSTVLLNFLLNLWLNLKFSYFAWYILTLEFLLFFLQFSFFSNSYEDIKIFYLCYEKVILKLLSGNRSFLFFVCLFTNFWFYIVFLAGLVFLVSFRQYI